MSDKETNKLIKVCDLPKEICNDNERQRRVYNIEGISPVVLARIDSAKIVEDRKDIHNMDLENNDVTYRVRKLTPTECWKLMGFKKEDIDKARAVGESNSALYEQAGNSIITNCVALLAEHLYKAQYDENYVCTDENFTQPQQ